MTDVTKFAPKLTMVKSTVYTYKDVEGTGLPLSL